MQDLTPLLKGALQDIRGACIFNLGWVSDRESLQEGEEGEERTTWGALFTGLLVFDEVDAHAYQGLTLPHDNDEHLHECGPAWMKEYICPSHTHSHRRLVHLTEAEGTLLVSFRTYWSKYNDTPCVSSKVW